jgi:Alpha-L-arabinofuranosidase
MKKLLLTALMICASYLSFSQSVTVAVDVTQNKRLIYPSIYGKNEWFDKTTQFYKDAGLRFARMNGGNNASAYNWRLGLGVHPDWYNNVYFDNWDASAQSLSSNLPGIQGMFAFQLLGRVASNQNNNFNDWAYNQSQYWSGVGQNLAGGGTPNPAGGSKALVDGDINLFSKPWPTDSSVAILTHWFGTNGLGLNKNQFQYWNMDNEVDVWNGTHDWAMPTLISASAFMDRYIELAKKAKALYPGIRLCGPVATSEWQWYKWGSESITINGKYYCWLEYFIKRCADEEKASGVRVLDVLDIHNYASANDDLAALQLHRMYYDQTYNYPGANGVHTVNGGWDANINSEYIFQRINDWLTTYYGANSGITCGVSEWWAATTQANANATAVVYASHLGTFANNGVELFSPWNWYPGMWETLHLFSKNAKKYSVSSTSSVENTVSAYSSINENADSLTIMLVNRDMNSSQSVTINLNNFNVANGNYKTLQLSSLPTTETFVSETQNALKTSTVAVSSNSLTISVPSLSTTAIILVKSTTPPQSTYVTLTNVATGLLVDGMGRTNNGDNCGQWSNSGSLDQQWVLETVGSYVKIKNRNTGLYLDGMGRTTNGSIVGQWSSSTSYNQQWQQVTSGNYIRFKNRATGLYLDGLGKTTNGADLGQYKKSSSNNQLWTISTLKSAKVALDETSGTNTEAKVSLFPNPFTTEINIQIDNPDQVDRIEVFNTVGKLVEILNKSSVKSSVAIGSSLSSGIYIVKIYAATGIKSYKIIKK